jgi:hypothetical protein
VTNTVLATICFLACVFYVCVLFHGMRDTKHNATPPRVADNESGETCEKKRPYIVGSRRTAERHDRTSVTSLQVQRNKEQSGGREPMRDACERTAYERVAGSLRLDKKR